MKRFKVLLILLPLALGACATNHRCGAIYTQSECSLSMSDWEKERYIDFAFCQDGTVRWKLGQVKNNWR